LKDDLRELADQFRDLENFYEHQRPTWEKLRKAHTTCQLNRLELEKDAQAAPALRRMQEILAASRPYALIKEANGLIQTVTAVNSSLLAERRKQAGAEIDAHLAILGQEIARVQGDEGLRAACVAPLEALREQVQRQESLAHITQAESEAVNEFDAAMGRIAEFAHLRASQKTPPLPGQGVVPPPPVVKAPRIVKPAELVKQTYLETSADVNGFLAALRQALEQALANHERIQIR